MESKASDPMRARPEEGKTRGVEAHWVQRDETPLRTGNVACYLLLLLASAIHHPPNRWILHPNQKETKSKT